MSIFDEPSRVPLPQQTFEDVKHAGLKALVSSIPFVGGTGSELISLLLSSPVAERRDVWLDDLQRRLHDLEGKVDGFRFDDLGANEQFVSATLHATQAALRTHQTEKLEALRNAVLNVAVGKAFSEDQQLIFLNLVDSFTPTHLQVLDFFQRRDATLFNELRSQRHLSDQAVRELHGRGLIKDTRPYAAQTKDTPESLVTYDWQITDLGCKFLAFIRSPQE
jgi:hypothetical protein